MQKLDAANNALKHYISRLSIGECSTHFAIAWAENTSDSELLNAEIICRK